MRKLFSASLVLALIIGLSVVGFSAEDTISIGTILPRTGALAAWGQFEGQATDLAAHQVNEAGGVLGKKLVLVHRDTKTNPTSGVDAANKLVNVNEVPVMVGANSSGVSLAVARAVAVPNEVVQIAVASTSPKLTTLEDNDYLFRTCPSDALQGIVLARLAYNDEGYETASTIYVNNAYGQGLSDNFEKAFEERGGEVLATVPYNKGKASYDAEIRKAAEGDPEVLMLLGYPENGNTILRKAIGTGAFENYMVADGMAGIPGVIEKVGAQYLEGTYGTVAQSPETKSLEYYKKGHEELFGFPPQRPAFLQNAYDAVILAALAMERAGEATGPAVKENLRAVAGPPGEEIDTSELERGFELIKEGKEIDYVGAAGQMDFDENGDVVSPFGILQVKDGEWKQIKVVD
ncbi:MAG: ABC transporter substrate-binding protein [Candidatus Bipolaricaulota bacterium]|nr:ABC transporter substrate-binding protein [Candidatus Bipolaricaulota bacterium]MBS3791310.1 ABC transporter substrate-binding protein [Candidatus Bipolaricaulota bacterium]